MGMTANQRALLALLVFGVAYSIAMNLQLFLQWREEFLAKLIYDNNRNELRNKLLEEEGITNV